MNGDYERIPDGSSRDLVVAAIVHVVILGGFFAVHFGVAALW